MTLLFFFYLVCNFYSLGREHWSTLSFYKNYTEILQGHTTKNDRIAYEHAKSLLTATHKTFKQNCLPVYMESVFIP